MNLSELPLRDYLASQITSEDIRYGYRDILSHGACEILAGKKPQKHSSDLATLSSEAQMNFHIECLKWQIKLDSTIRYMVADAMIEARTATLP